MIYTAVEWLHAFPNEPTRLYYELDEERQERRKVEMFRDGKIQYADASRECGSTWLSLEPHPSLEKIAADPQFKINEISEAEFAEIWDKAVENGNQVECQ